jgi:hypothetical protein
LKTVFSTHVENSRFSEIRQVDVSLNKAVSTNAEEGRRPLGPAERFPAD